MRCHGDSSVTLTPRRRKSTKSSTDKSPLQSPVAPTDLSAADINFQRQRQLALQEQSPDDRSSDLTSIVPPWATHAYMQTLLPPTVEVKPTLEELAEYVGTLHEAETLDQGQRGETPDSVASSNLAPHSQHQQQPQPSSSGPSASAAGLVSTPGQQPMRTPQQIPSISTFIRNRNPADELAPHNMNPGGAGDATVNSHSPTQHIIPLTDEDSTNHSLNSQPNDATAHLAGSSHPHVSAAATHPAAAAAATHTAMDHSSAGAAAATAAAAAAAAQVAATSTSQQDGGAPPSTSAEQQQATPPPQGPGTPIDLAAQAAAAQAAGGGAAHQQGAAGDPMSLVSDENRSSVLSIELLQVFSKFGLDPQVIVDTLVLQGKLYRCVSCNIIFPEYSTFVLHKGCHGNRHPYQCHFCQVIFPEKFGFLTHFMQCPRK